MNSPTPSAPMITLGELIDRGAIEVTSGFPCGDHNSDGAGVLQIRPFNVTVNSTIALSTQKHVPASAAAGRPILETGDIVFNNTNTKELVGKTAVWNGPTGSVFSNHMTRIRPTVSGLSSLYLASAIHAHWVTGRSEMLARSHVAQASILGKRFREIQIPWPKESAQVIFADAFKNAQDSIQIQSDIVESLSALKGTVMRELFSRGLRGEAQKDSEIGLVPESWDVEAIGSHFLVGSGGTPPRGNARFWQGGQIPWVKTTEVQYNVITETEEHITADGLANSAAKMLPAGTLLMAMYGQGVTRGKVAILGIDAACNQACASMNRRADGQIEPRYLFHFLTYRYEDIRSFAHGGQQQNLNLDIVRDLQIAFPRNEEQQTAIVEVLDAIDAKIGLHRRKKAVLEELFRSLLHKLMAGEIRVAELDLSALATKHEVVA